jgi:hypothetical protein
MGEEILRRGSGRWKNYAELPAANTNLTAYAAQVLPHKLKKEIRVNSCQSLLR